MAQKLEANVLDPTWILDQDSGKLKYGFIRRVSSHPAQTLRVQTETDHCTEIMDRYLRIAADRQRRREC
jgi:hypothetical protein